MIASVVSTFAIIKICYAPFVKTAETATSKCFVEVWQIDRKQQHSAATFEQLKEHTPHYGTVQYQAVRTAKVSKDKYNYCHINTYFTSSDTLKYLHLSTRLFHTNEYIQALYLVFEVFFALISNSFSS